MRRDVNLGLAARFAGRLALLREPDGGFGLPWAVDFGLPVRVSALPLSVCADVTHGSAAVPKASADCCCHWAKACLSPSANCIWLPSTPSIEACVGMRPVWNAFQKASPGSAPSDPQSFRVSMRSVRCKVCSIASRPEIAPSCEQRWRLSCSKVPMRNKSSRLALYKAMGMPVSWLIAGSLVFNLISVALAGC